MNEQRKTRYEYFNPKEPDEKLDPEALYRKIYDFRANKALKYGDLGKLTGLLTQLKQKNLPRKVFRSVQTKFNLIQQSYQR